MQSSIKQFMSFLREKKALYDEFNLEVFEGYLDAGVDNFANLSEIWLWFPAASHSLGWYEKEKSPYLIDRFEFVLYILWMRESENLAKSSIDLIQFIDLVYQVCKDLPIAILEELKKKMNLLNYSK